MSLWDTPARVAAAVAASSTALSNVTTSLTVRVAVELLMKAAASWDASPTAAVDAWV